MKRFVCIAIAALLLLVASAARMVNHSVPAAAAGAPQQPAQNDRHREKLQRLRIEDSHGDAAAHRVRQLKRLSKGIARAMQDADKRGLRKAFEHSRVILGIEPSDKQNQAARITPSVPRFMQVTSYNSSHSQDTFTDGEYEVTFIPYDDGDPNTWEGIIYRYDPDWGDDIRYCVVDIQTDAPNVVEEIYYPPDGGDPQPLDPNVSPVLLGSNGPRTCKPITPSLSVRTKANASSGLSSRPVCPPGWRPCLRLRDECCSPPANLNTWFRCSAKACGGIAAGCSRTGPIFGECWGFGCTGAMLLCLL